MKLRNGIYFPWALLFVGMLTITSSCSYKHYKGFEPVVAENVSPPRLFDTAFSKVVYTTNFRVFNQELSGLTLVKKVKSTNSFHIVFMSQIGLKFFDIEIKPNETEDWFHVNFIMESLNREFIVSTLKTDFMLLFSKYPEHAETGIFRNTENEITETTVRFDKYISSIFTDRNNKITGIELRKGRSVKTSIHITPGKEYPKELDIHNKKGGMNLTWKEIRM
ncbi:MAG: hypothetical protein DRI88_12165 [Bacteroidetes bacterium]|nr:MAG: hypothetical protein DRI72_05835 [Bacteroidota bacterium]RLD41887.1 MAG: hypothetical protein DRI88_12165 [Bacteroidota bacterium]RLD86056.1 MAG: hypothetical protein DRJ02_09285 [Bacteroidota bacterium]